MPRRGSVVTRRPRGTTALTPWTPTQSGSWHWRRAATRSAAACDRRREFPARRESLATQVTFVEHSRPRLRRVRVQRHAHHEAALELRLLVGEGETPPSPDRRVTPGEQLAHARDEDPLPLVGRHHALDLHVAKLPRPWRDANFD